MNKNVRYSQKKTLNQRECKLYDSCRQSIRQHVEYHDITLDEARVQTVKLGQLLDALQKSVQLLAPKGKHFVQKVDL